MSRSRHTRLRRRPKTPDNLLCRRTFPRRGERRPAFERTSAMPQQAQPKIGTLDAFSFGPVECISRFPDSIWGSQSMRNVVWMVLGSLAIAAAPAVAQDKPVEINIGFGWMFPSTSGLKNDFNAGWTGTIGATFWVNPKVGIMAEYTYDHMHGPDKTIAT